MLHHSLDYLKTALGLTTCCLLCEGPVTHNAPSKPPVRKYPLCDGCETDLPWLGTQCALCALPLVGTESFHCGECLQSPPLWTRCLAVFEYRYPIDRLISRFKQQGDLAAGRILAELFCQHTLANADILPDLLIPVPLHWRRQLHRGFNQSLELTKPLAATLGIPCANQLVKKQNATPDQHRLSRQERERNLKAAFKIVDKLEGLRIALIDDVVTTGSTARAITQQLLKAGAAEVEIWCVARTPKPDHP